MNLDDIKKKEKESVGFDEQISKSVAFWSYCSIILKNLNQEKSYLEEKNFFTFNNLLDGLLALSKVEIGKVITLSSLNTAMRVVQANRDQISDKFECLTYLVSKYEEVWLDITKLWVSFNEAKSEARALGNLLFECDEARALKTDLNELKGIHKAFELEWRHLLRNSNDIETQASILRDQRYVGEEGLSDYSAGDDLVGYSTLR